MSLASDWRSEKITGAKSERTKRTVEKEKN